MDVVIAGLIYRVRSFPRHHRQRTAWLRELAEKNDICHETAVREGVSL